MSSDESDDEARMGFRSSSVSVDNSGNGAKGKATSEAGRGEAPAAMPLKSTFGVGRAEQQHGPACEVAGIKDEGYAARRTRMTFSSGHGRTMLLLC